MIVEPDEVKTKAQPSTGRKEVGTYTAVVRSWGLGAPRAVSFSDLTWIGRARLLPSLISLPGLRWTWIGRARLLPSLFILP